MKKTIQTILLAGLVTAGLGSCGNGEASAPPSSPADSIKGPVPDNSSATNPSMADTAYPKKDSMRMDSSKNH